MLIYGCYGYTGRLITEYAKRANLQPILSGRDEERTRTLAQEYGFEYRTFDLDDAEVVKKNLEDIKVLLHCAGPFKYTARVMAKACLHTKTHYLDITGEYQVFEDLARLDKEAENVGIVIMPGVGFDVVPSDCLALYLKEKLPTANKLELALLQKGGRLSHGTAITVTENMGLGCVVREKGKLVTLPAGQLTREINLGDKVRTAAAIPWGDISTAFRSTKIPNITVYNFLPDKVIRSMRLSNYLSIVLQWQFVKRFLINRIKKRPPGPNENERKNAASFIWGEVKNDIGITKSALLELPEGYTLTAMTAVEIAQRMMNSTSLKGYNTPAMAFGKDFILQFDGVTRKDLSE